MKKFLFLFFLIKSFASCLSYSQQNSLWAKFRLYMVIMIRKNFVTNQKLSAFRIDWQQIHFLIFIENWCVSPISFVVCCKISVKMWQTHFISKIHRLYGTASILQQELLLHWRISCRKLCSQCDTKILKCFHSSGSKSFTVRNKSEEKVGNVCFQKYLNLIRKPSPAKYSFLCSVLLHFNTKPFFNLNKPFYVSSFICYP